MVNGNIVLWGKFKKNRRIKIILIKILRNKFGKSKGNKLLV